MASDGENGEIGYGRPPKHSQFQKGQSGNPRGRPRGAPSIKSDLGAALQEPIDIVEHGKRRKITKQRALLNTLIAAAIKDFRAMKPLLEYMRYSGVGLDEPPADGIDLDNLDLLENYVRQQRKKQSRSNSDS